MSASPISRPAAQCRLLEVLGRADDLEPRKLVHRFALPLLIFKLTGSALNLAIASATTFLPYLLFGLLIGAWVDRVDRKRLMIVTDLLRALVLASIPLLAALDMLSVWWIYTAGFLTSTLTIGFNSAEFAAIPSLVAHDDTARARRW